VALLPLSRLIRSRFAPYANIRSVSVSREAVCTDILLRDESDDRFVRIVSHVSPYVYNYSSIYFRIKLYAARKPRERSLVSDVFALIFALFSLLASLTSWMSTSSSDRELPVTLRPRRSQRTVQLSDCPQLSIYLAVNIPLWPAPLTPRSRHPAKFRYDSRPKAFVCRVEATFFKRFILRDLPSFRERIKVRPWRSPGAFIAHPLIGVLSNARGTLTFTALRKFVNFRDCSSVC